MGIEGIGATAGGAWRCLSDRGPQGQASLKERAATTDRSLSLARGWLAREDKVSFRTRGRAAGVVVK